MNFEEWLQFGINQGWCGPTICYTHDGIPTSEAEDNEFEEGDPCIHILRLYEDYNQKVAIQQNHAPSVWRATNAGYDV